MSKRAWVTLGATASVIAVVIGAVVIWLNATANLAARDENFERIQSSGTLRVGLDASFPPFEFIGDDNAVLGFDADVARELARRMNLRVAFVTTGFDALYDELTASHYDVIVSGLPYDRLRSQDVGYSDIYFRGGEVLLARADVQGIKTLSDLGGQSIGVELATSAEVLAKKLERRNGYRTQSYTTLEDAARALEAGDVRGVIADAVSARLVRRNHPQLVIVGEPLGDEPNYVIAVPLNSPSLLATINKHLRAMEKDGTLTRFVDKWF